MPRQKRILVVDDDPRNRKLEEALLRADGYDVRCAESGAAALAAVAAEVFDLVLLDLMMPGMDGFEVVRRLKADAATRAIPIVLLSAVDDEAARARLGSAGAAEFLSKPVDRWALKARIEAILGSGGDDAAR